MSTGWNCECGAKDIKEVRCPDCNRTQARTIYNEIVVRHLYERDAKGARNIDVIERYAYGLAKQRSVPAYLVDDVVSEALFAIVANIDKYDSAKGSFRTWAITIIRNKMSAMAGKDATYNDNIELSVDAVGPDGEILAEAIEGDSLTIDDIIDEEKQVYMAMRDIARRILGTVVVVDEDSGEQKLVDVYDLCLKAYLQTDGVGWLSLAALWAGMTKQALSRRKIKMEHEWERWSEK